MLVEVASTGSVPPGKTRVTLADLMGSPETLTTEPLSRPPTCADNGTVSTANTTQRPNDAHAHIAPSSSETRQYWSFARRTRASTTGLRSASASFQTSRNLWYHSFAFSVS